MSSRFAAAIRDRRIVEFSYKGRNRAVEPHAVGYDASGALVLHGWELSSRGQGFREFELGEIRGLTITARSFEAPRPEYASHTAPLKTIVHTL